MKQSTHTPWKRLALSLVFVLACAAVLVQPGWAQNEVGVIRGAPLTIQPFRNGSLQVWHNRYNLGASYGTAGSGFFIVLNQVSYGPLYRQMDFVEQKPVEGQGSRANPFRSVLRLRIKDATASLDVAQTVLYANGEQSFQLDWQVTNSGSGNACVRAYHAADLYFANDDRGSGYYNARTGSVGGYNRARDWFMVFTPLTPAKHYEEAYYGTIWERVRSQQDLKDTLVSEYVDNGAALQWDFCLGAGQSKTISDAWSFGESEGAILAAAQQAGSHEVGPLGLGAEHYRPVEPGAPALTTTIPTPLDISLSPEVVGANLLWAAVATLLFTIASEVLNRTLVEFESFAKGVMKPWKALQAWQRKAGLAERLGRPVWYEWLKLVLIILVYGLVFSFLDPSWEPLSLNGVWLLIIMAIAFGVVGLADDITQWNTARRWKLPTRISILPGNLLLAIGSTLFSRYLVLTPGIMFGMPEAFEIDPGSLDSKRKARLLALAAGVLIAILLGSWLPTALSALALRAGQGLPEGIRPFVLFPVTALQSLLLLVFAVTVQNLFLHMLALPDTIGEGIKRWNRAAWFFALLMASYVYLQTLLNPNGDLARSLQTSNIRVFLGTIALFLVFTVISRAVLLRISHRPANPIAVQPVPSAGMSPLPAYPPQPAAPPWNVSAQPQPAAPGGLPPTPAPAAILNEQETVRVSRLPAGVPEPQPTLQAPQGGIAPANLPASLPNLPIDVQHLLSGWAMASPAARQTLLQRVAAHGQPGLHLLVQSFQHPDPTIRLAAVSAVGSLGDHTCLPAIQPLLNDRDPNVVQVAQWAVSIVQNK